MSDKSIIQWSKDYELSWSDFLAEPNPAYEHDALTSIRFYVNPTITADNPNQPKFFFISKISIIPEFQKKLSWVREYIINDPNAGIKFLKHEQGHFDLAMEKSHEIESMAEKTFFDKKFPIRGKNEHEILEYAREDAIALVNEQVEKIKTGYFTSQRQTYDRDTEYGNNLERQNEYNKRFEQLRK